MKRLAVWGIALSAFAAVLVSGSLMVRAMRTGDDAVSGVPSGGATLTAAEVGATIVLDPPYNYTTFSPPAPGQEAAITANAALALFKTVAPDFIVPADASAQLGLYTVSSPSGEYAYKDQLAWGFSWHQCPTAAEARHANVTIAPDDPCTFWLFLDANTGEMLVAHYQR